MAIVAVAVLVATAVGVLVALVVARAVLRSGTQHRAVHDALLSRACRVRSADLAAEFPQLSASTIQTAAWNGQYSRWRDGEEP